MPIPAWLRPLRHLTALFIVVIVLPALALAWLAWRTLQQDRELERQRVQERLENVTTGIAAGLERRLQELHGQLSSPEAEASRVLPADSLFVTIRDAEVIAYPPGRLLYYPTTPAGRRVPPGTLEAAEKLEYRNQDYPAAAAAFRGLARSTDPAIQAAALLGLGRCLRKSGQAGEALAAYDQLARLGTSHQSESLRRGGQPAVQRPQW